MDHSDQPSTSQNCPSQTDSGKKKKLVSEEELEKDAKRLDVRLEDCAKKYNLSSLNVRNIIFHIIRDPHTLAALLDGDANAIESLRLTRSRLREIEKVAQTKLNIELKPVSTKSTRPTLLDIELSDDDEDPDYEPPPVDETAELDKYEFGDFTEEELAAENTFDNTEEWFGHDVGHQMETICRDPEYAKFIESCVNPTSVEIEYPEETDEDYNIVQDEEILDLDEFRNDRSTRVSKRELRYLYDDILPDEYLAEEPSIKKPKCKRRLSFDSRSTTPSGPFTQRQDANLNNYYNTGNLNHSDDLTYFDPMVASTSRQTMQEQVRQFEQINSQRMDRVEVPDGSWSLLKIGSEPARFSNEELHCLRVQMEKHVQLLAQNIVATTDMPQLISTRNQAVRMLHELDSNMYTNANQFIFQIRNLPEAVISCHEIESFDNSVYEQVLGSGASERYKEPSFTYKAAAVLAESRALLYPELLPSTLPQNHAAPFSNFIAPEQMLLALALFELHHVPHSTGGVGRVIVSKYQTISTYFLPNKTPNQIRNHLKNVRSGSGTSPLHQLIMFAEQGKFNATVELDNGLTQRQELPIDWPSNNLLPRWLQAIQNLRLTKDSIQLPPIVHSIQSINSTDFQRAIPSTPITQQHQNPNYSVVQLYDGQVQMVSPNVLHLNGAPLNSPAQIVVLNGQTHVVFNQQNASNMSSRIPNSPFQSYTIKKEPMTLENVDNNEIIVIDEEGDRVLVQQTSNLNDQQVIQENDDGDVIEVVDVVQTPQQFTPTTNSNDNTPNHQFNQIVDETANNSEIIYERQTPPEPQRIERANATPTQSRQEALQVETQPSRKSSTTSQFDQQTTQKADHSHQSIQQKKANEPKEKVESEKMSRRREQISKCMKGFDDPEVVELWSSMVLQTVYNLVKRRLFMHDGKYKTFISVLSNPKKSCADKYDELARLLRDTQPELADCIAALMDDDELRADQKENTERTAYKCALEMMMNILIYFHGQQNANMKKRLLKVIRDFCFTEQNLREEMQKLLSGRHEPLWTRLKQYFRGERYKEKINMSRAEEAPLALFNAFGKSLQGKHKSKSLDLRSEFVDLTTPTANQKVEQQHFNPDLRLKNGYLMLRMPDGESVPVNLCSPTRASQVEEEMQKRKNIPVIGSIFGPTHDRQLLFAYNNYKTQPAKAVEKFLSEQQKHYPIGECPFDEENTQRRLNFLLELISTMNNLEGNIITAKM